ncbi:gastrula zinc finger protein XlCGF42.1-like [Acanthopagrus latus]|uniref:gastrula zinc finger protein XlCGF42.1-like n=1 Tax=Acanthopagrus latus TaxID=8177 RepID=UPI00187CADCF|nr:gastrula zinc finger protein XlCGF42.1-like [Acanthopagrus latus]
METSSGHCLKKFVNERLTAAAEEIFGMFEKTLLVYKEEILRHRRLLDGLTPDTKLRSTALPQPSVCKEEVFLDLQQCDSEKSVGPDQEDSKPPLIKVEVEEVCTDEDEQETEVYKLRPGLDGSDHSENLTLHLDQSRSAPEGEPQTSTSTPDEGMQSDSESKERKSSVDTDPERDNDQHARTGGAQCVCTICGKSFKIRKYLQIHRKIHTGVKPHSCKYCGREFVCGSSLKRHLRVHTGEKPYECRLCGKRFRVSTTLRVHYRIHTGEKPFKCETCEREFTTSSNLKQHMALHS